MELWIKYAIVIVISYLLGSLNFAIIFSKAFLKTDVRDYGSGNAGSTNAYRLMGGKRTVLVMLGDILKGVVAALLAGALFGELHQFGGIGKLVAGVAVVLGHVFPVYFGFKGGKGVLTAAAMLALFDVRVVGIVLAVFLIAVLLTRYISLGSILAAFSLPFAMLLLYGWNLPYIVIGLCLGAFVIYLHRANIRRLLSGTESKFSFQKKNKS